MTCAKGQRAYPRISVSCSGNRAEVSVLAVEPIDPAGVSANQTGGRAPGSPFRTSNDASVTMGDVGASTVDTARKSRSRSPMQTAAPRSSPFTTGYRAACRSPTTRLAGGMLSRDS